MSRRLSLLLLMISAGGGCSLFKARPEIRYYTLAPLLPALPPPGPGQAPSGATGPPGTVQVTVHPTAQAAVPDKPALLIRRLWAREPYGQSRMVYRSSPYRIEFYNYHLWASPPAEQVSEWATRYLRATDLFGRVTTLPEAGGALDLGGVLRQFEEIDKEDGRWEAAMSIDFWLVRAGQREPFWFRSYSATRAAARRNPEAVAEAMSHNLEDILKRLAADLLPVVTREPVRPAEGG